MHHTVFLFVRERIFLSQISKMDSLFCKESRKGLANSPTHRNKDGFTDRRMDRQRCEDWNDYLDTETM